MESLALGNVPDVRIEDLINPCINSSMTTVYMTKKDAAIQKALAELGHTAVDKLSPEDEKKLQLALDPEAQFLQDIQDLYDKTPNKA